ncbi:hypothetical protein PAESOLCIP111_01335 [Paenibacillus solanacearum]|uniref:Uncharacterized protein n=1 Tax=Paenibacillus solanacearum TaxID=2048548 RepID=A0A916JWL9_9BACL|nr:hypothetical protein [Paenibacillus solanacearum]CAG7611125.1 hypothetical protein PAESOLCIP111_01335 [Paenibacillus solanacearum]
MWESVWKKETLEIQMNPERKSIMLQMSEGTETAAPLHVQLNQSELFELLHTFLNINRSFNKETMYYDDASRV